MPKNIEYILNRFLYSEKLYIVVSCEFRFFPSVLADCISSGVPYQKLLERGVSFPSENLLYKNFVLAQIKYKTMPLIPLILSQVNYPF